MLRVILRCALTCHVLPVVVLLMAGNAGVTYGKTSPLLLISLDGFRHDYLEIAQKFRQQTPTFDRLIREGVSVESPGVTNVFYTKTFPNHYSMVTGLYQEVHGIIGNDFYDPVFHETFTMRNLDQKWWNGTGDYPVVPIWVTNEQAAGDNRTSGVFYWPGSEVKGQQPHYFKPYDKTVPFNARVDEIVSWFTDKQRPINFGLMYFHEPDQTGHAVGPLTEAVAEKIAELDGHIEYLLKKFESVDLLNEMNIILTSDHGMETITSYVYLSDYVNTSLVYTSYGGSPVRHVIPQPGR
jgi:ectonucleotide pyrophosphatase/phosphodiesterase family member 5